MQPVDVKGLGLHDYYKLCQSKKKFHPILQLFDPSHHLLFVSTCCRCIDVGYYKILPMDNRLSHILVSCVKKGYMKDDYIHLFVRRPVRKSPIINRENQEPQLQGQVNGTND